MVGARDERGEGRWKGGQSGYPRSLVHEGHLYATVSRQEEGAEVLRGTLGELGQC